MEAILFDLDGVIIDSETEYTTIWSEIERLFPTGVQDFARVIKGTTLPDILNTYFPAQQHEAVTAQLRQREAQMQYEYCPGAYTLLKALKESEIQTAIVTSSKADKMQYLRQLHPELFDMVDVVIDADSVTRSKPDPQGYQLAMQALQTTPAKCIVIEDSLQGVRAGKNAGAYVIGLTGTMGRNIIAPEADLCIDSLQETDVTMLREILSRNIDGE